MNQSYLNSPSVGRAISAEEFAAGGFLNGCHGSSPSMDCGCGTAAPTPPACSCPAPDPCAADDCGPGQAPCQPMICCCKPVPAPPPAPPQVEEGCCCKQSFRAALNLLCNQQISNLLDFDTTAFLTSTYVAGTTLEAAATPEPPAEEEAAVTPTAVVPSVTPTDNLATLAGSFRRFAPCNGDLIDIRADVYTAAGGTAVFTASQVSLCELDAVVIQGATATAEGDLTAEEVTARNFRCVRTLLSQRLNPCGDPCNQNCCSCTCDCRDCCCAAGLLSTLAQNNISRRVSLVAGLLILNSVTLLGTVGNVLVLSNDTENRLYFVCVNSIQFIG